MRPDFRDPRLLLLVMALTLTLLALVAPLAPIKRRSFDSLVVVDITGSMNTRDYNVAGRPVSRLEFVKAALRDFVAGLPCASRLALGVFSERRSFLLFEPIEVCANYAPLAGAIEALDWRMAWEGDSRVAAGLSRLFAALPQSMPSPAPRPGHAAFSAGAAAPASMAPKRICYSTCPPPPTIPASPPS